MKLSVEDRLKILVARAELGPHVENLVGEAIHEAVSAEREACAKIAEGLSEEWPEEPGDAYFSQGWAAASDKIAASIRAKGDG